MTLNLFALCPVSLSSEELAGHLAEVTDLLIRLHDWLGLPPSHPMLELRWGHVSPR